MMAWNCEASFVGFRNKNKESGYFFQSNEEHGEQLRPGTVGKTGIPEESTGEAVGESAAH